MDVPADILKELKCSRCSGYLSRGPVFLQHDGAAACGQCSAPERPATRNTQYEATARMLKFPCKYRELGCLETVPFAEGQQHEAVCEHRPMCAECGAEVTVFRFRDAGGWRCERCAPARRACGNQGCTHTDIGLKTAKHEEWFCEQRIKCVICAVLLPRGTLSAHYGAEHQGDTYCSGSTWRTTQDLDRCFLLSSVAGTAGCFYMLDDTQFVVWVYIPVPSERLREFRCVLTLSDPATGHASTYTPDTLYSVWHDWRIEVMKEDFQSWNTEFDVSLDIIQSEP